MPRTVSPLEVAWIAGALHGIWYARRNLANARAELRALLAQRRNGDLRVLADQKIRNDQGRLSSLVACLIMGIVSLALSNQPGSFSAPRLVIAACIFYIEYRLVWDSRGDSKVTALLLDIRNAAPKKRRSADPQV